MVNQRGRYRGASLMSALFLVTLVMLIAATLVSVYSNNLNLTQRSFNGSIAQAEAEAGIAEALYHMTREGAVDNGTEPPRVSFGRANETLRATVTPNMGPEEAYHVVTFDASSAFPHSTNNTYLDSSSGSLGRTVPDGSFHLVSTGYCKGQWRTVEAVVKKPPFPFGLATSGKIESTTAMVVKGVSSTQALINGDEDRPGHILCNSSDGVVVGDSGPVDTYITGFVKAVGPIDIAQPATVLGGLRPGSDESTLVDIDVTSFKNEGEPGVVTILDPIYPDPQDLDIMYFFDGPSLTYERAVNLNKAFLYVQGDLTMRGPVTGEGLIVVDGNARFESGTALSGSNKMAVLASGDITIIGNNNYFAGLVYAERNLIASNVTIVGNTIVNSGNASLGQAQLENVGIVSNEETADMTINITYYPGMNGAPAGGNLAVPVHFVPGTPPVFGIPAGVPQDQWGGLPIWPTPDKSPSDLAGQLVEFMWTNVLSNPGEPFPVLALPPFQPTGSAGLAAEATRLHGIGEGLHDIASAIQKKQDEIEALPDGHSDIPGLQAEKAQLEADLQAYRDEHESQFAADALAYVQQVYEFTSTHTQGDGSGDTGFLDPADIDVEFNLNEYLPESERVKVTFWRVYNRRF